MTICTRTVCLVVIILILSGNSHGLAQGDEPLLFMGEENVFPYSFTEKGKIKGTDHDLVVEAARRMGIPVTIILVPWKRMKISVEHGFCDAGFAMFYKGERKKFGIYARPPLHYSTYSIFVRKGEAFPFESVKDLYGKTVGNVIGYHISKAFDQAVAEGLIVTEDVADADQNLKKLVSGRIDCLVSNHDMALVKISEYGFSGLIVPLPKPVKASKGAYIVFSKAGKNISHKEEFVRKFSAVLQEMQQDGTYGKIYRKYIKGF